MAAKLTRFSAMEHNEEAKQESTPIELLGRLVGRELELALDEFLTRLFEDEAEPETERTRAAGR